VEDQEWTKDEKRNLKDKANKFEVLNDGKDGPWPHGNCLHIKIFQPGCKIKSGLKLYIPTWQKKWILKQFHSNNGRAGHFGCNRLHKMVSSINI
jgi:hypothetical protein